MNYIINGLTKIITPTDAPVDGAISIDVQDVYSEWVDWLLTSDNSKFLIAMRSVGGDPLPGSKALGLTYFLMNGWKIRPYEADHTFNINGNLYCEDGTSPFISTLGSYNVTIISSVSSLVDSTVQQLPEIEYASYQNQVTIDVNNGTSGTAYPIGTPTSPVNNLANAKTIAATRGFDTLFLLSDLTITTGQSVDDLRIVSDNWLHVEVETGASTMNTEFVKVDIDGELSGFWNVLEDCWANNITNFTGWLRGGSFTNIELAPYTPEVPPSDYALGQSFFDEIVPMYPLAKSTIVFNTDTSVAVTSYSGLLELKSLTTGSEVSAGFRAGKLIVDSSCAGGTIITKGVGTVQNDSSVIIDATGLVSPSTGGGASAEDVRIEMDSYSQIAKDAKQAKLNTF